MSRNNYDLHKNPQFLKGIDLWSPDKRRGVASAVPGGTTFIVSNFPAFAFTDFTGTGSASNADSPGGSLVNCICQNVDDSASGFVTAGAATRRNWSPRIRFKFAAGNVITSVRWWLGAYASDPSALTTLAGISAACFGYDTEVDGTAYWRCKSSNAATMQTTATDVAVVASHLYTGDIVMDNANSQVLFYLADHGLLTATKTEVKPKLVAIHATSVPVADTPLLIGGTVTTLVAASPRRIVLGEVSLSQN